MGMGSEGLLVNDRNEGDKNSVWGSGAPWFTFI